MASCILTSTSFDINKIYPVGSIYMSTNLTDPGTLFGGTWEQIKDTFLLAAGDTYSAGSTGGEASHTLTVDEMPAHTHSDHTVNIQASDGKDCQDWWRGISTATTVTGSTGGDQPHNNMPPYLTVYMFKRVS